MQVCTVRTLVSRIAVIRAVLVLLLSDLLTSAHIVSVYLIVKVLLCLFSVNCFFFLQTDKLRSELDSHQSCADSTAKAGISKAKRGEKGR